MSTHVEWFDGRVADAIATAPLATHVVHSYASELADDMKLAGQTALAEGKAVMVMLLIEPPA